MSTHAIPYHTIPYHTIPFHTILYHRAVPYHTIPYYLMPYRLFVFLFFMPSHVVRARRLRCRCWQALTLGLEDPAAAQASKAHVHAYVNAFYFGEDDLHNWIKVGARCIVPFFFNIGLFSKSSTQSLFHARGFGT